MSGGSHATPVGQVVGDPWRYVCTSCGSTSVMLKFARRRKRSERIGDRDMAPGEYAAELSRQRSARFRCEACGAHSLTVYDKKRGTDVRRDAL